MIQESNLRIEKKDLAKKDLNPFGGRNTEMVLCSDMC